MNDAGFRPPARLTGVMTPEEKVLMVASIDHDARTPQQVLGFAHKSMDVIIGQMLDPAADIDTLRKLANRLRVEIVTASTSSRQIVDLQQDLVDALRLELDDTNAQPRKMNADDLLYRARKNNESMAINLQFELRAARSRLEFVADERWVERILSNLVVNAIRHSNGSRILLGAREREGDIVFEVRDNGRGMKPEAVARVFEPLTAPNVPFIGHPAARSGLGLYNVRLYTQRMGGAVSCRSEPGAGTTFEVRLPGPVSRGERRRRRDDAQIIEAVKNKIVAVLDDDIEMLKTTERMFEGLGITVFSGDEPVRWFNSMAGVPRMPDLFLMDYQLKGQDVELTLSMVKRKFSDQRPRVIIVTGHINNAALLRISKTVPVLRKPLNDARFDQVLEILAGQADLPEAGFL